MARHPLLDDDRFKIGFEFEFIIHGHESLMSSSECIKISSLNYSTFKAAFNINKEQSAQIEAILTYRQHFTKNKFDFADLSEEAGSFGIPKLIALLKLKPRNKKWYTESSTFRSSCDDPVFFDKSKEINSALDSLDISNYDEVTRFARRLSHHFVLSEIIENLGGVNREQEKNIFKNLSVIFSEKLGVKMDTCGNYYVEEEESFISTNWNIKTEYFEDTDDTKEFGLEITTPPLPPREALKYAKKILEILSDNNLPFKVKLLKDCGVHVNVSHPDVKINQVSPIYYSLMNDEKAMMLPFHRTNQEACLAYSKNIRELTRKLVRHGLISLDMLNTTEGLKHVVTMIDSHVDYGKFISAYFYNMHKLGYIEYRMAGGKGYTKKYKELEYHVCECLRITKSFTHNRFDDRVFAHKVKTLLIKAGAGKRKTVPFPREVFMRSKR